jgi:carboxyl-terminal processing protease
MKRFAAILSAGLLASAPVVTADMDYNLVGKVAATMLRNLHFNKLPLDGKLSERLLEEYLSFLDFRRAYLTKADVEEFRRKYGQSLHRHLLDANCMEPAKEMFLVYLKRVGERHAWIEKTLADTEFTFDGDDTVELSREKAAWPADAAAADALWVATLKDNLLRERLRAEDAKSAEAAPPAGEGAKPAPAPEDPKDKILKRYKRVLENLRETNDEEICDYFLSALSLVYDPHTEYFSHSEEEQFQTNMKNSLTGIGALLQADDEGTTQIKGIVVGGPADKQAELQLDDRIIAVDPDNSGEMVDIMYMKINKVVELIRGKRNSEVRLKIIPANDPASTREIVITRDVVELKDQLSTAQIIHRKDDTGREFRLGWITVPSFYADMEKGATGVTKDVRRLLTRLKQEGIDGLAIDLRGNGGGSLDEAVNLTGLFIPAGPVVQVKDSLGNVKVLESKVRTPLYDGPLVVVTDKTSASASEIFAAALQDSNRAVVVGGRSTFGKGTVQTVAPVGRAMPLFADSERAGSLKVTIQKFYRIAGGSTQLKGVEADIPLPSRLEALKIGEDALKDPLPFDTIKARSYTVFPPENLFRRELASLSAARLAEDPEIAYIRDDISRMKEQVEKNTLPLNLEQRRREAAEIKTRNRERNALRRERFAAIQKEESAHTRIYRVTLDNVEAPELELQSDFSQADNGMRRSKTDNEDEEDIEDDKAPDPPFGFDPLKREAIAIAADLIRLTAARGSETVKVP